MKENWKKRCALKVCAAFPMVPAQQVRWQLTHLSKSSAAVCGMLKKIVFFWIISGAACFGLKSGSFPFNVATKEFGKVITMSVDCLKYWVLAVILNKSLFIWKLCASRQPTFFRQTVFCWHFHSPQVKHEDRALHLVGAPNEKWPLRPGPIHVQPAEQDLRPHCW